MRNALLFSFLIAFAVHTAAQTTPAQTPSQAKPAAPAPTTAKPIGPPAPVAQTPAAQTPPARSGQPATTAKPAAPATGRAAAAGGRSGIALTVTDMKGATISGVHVELSGPTNRVGETDAGGQVNFPGLQVATYRMRFSGDTVTAFEREVTLRAGGVTTLDISLSAAPPPKEIEKIVEVAAPAAATPATATLPVGPKGQTQILSLVDLAEREYERKQPRRESLVACSGNTRSTLLQLNQDQPDRLYENAEAVFYVVAGEGALRIDSKDTKLNAGGFVSVPRATSFSVVRRGNKPLILLTVLSGEPCENAK